MRVIFNTDAENDNGSEYGMVNVANGVSQVQHNGTSLHNSTNEDATAALVKKNLAKGWKPSEISVLVYYTGQLDVVIHKIEANDAGQWEDMAFRRQPRILRRCVSKRRERASR